MPPPPQKVQHIFCKCNLHAIQNCPPVIQRWQEPKRPLASSFFFSFFLFSISQLSFLTGYYCFTCLEMGNVGTLINGLKDDLVSLQHISLRISGFFYEIQFGKLLHQSTELENAGLLGGMLPVF